MITENNHTTIKTLLSQLNLSVIDYNRLRGYTRTKTLSVLYTPPLFRVVIAAQIIIDVTLKTLEHQL